MLVYESPGARGSRHSDQGWCPSTGTLFKGATPPADAVVPPTGSQLGDATGVPSVAATNAALTTTTESVATKRRAVAAVKPVHVDVADSTVASQKSGAAAPANVTDAKSDDAKSDDAKSDDTNAKADNGKSVLKVSEIGTSGNLRHRPE